MQGLGISFAFLIILVLCALDVILGVKAIQKRTKLGRAFALTSFMVALASVAHCLRHVMPNDFAYSMASSVYFVCMNFMLFYVLMFIHFYTHGEQAVHGRKRFIVLFVILCIDSLIVLINPFFDIVLTFTPVENGNFYESHVLYYLHLTISYFMVFSSLLFLLVKMAGSPKGYKRQYMYAGGAILIIMAVNLIFRTLPSLDKYNYADATVVLYSICVYIFYWCSYWYSTHGMLNHFKNSIFENVNQAVLLFDRDDKLILHNQLAKKFLSAAPLSLGQSLSSFLNDYEIPIMDTSVDEFSFQCMVKTEEKKLPLRCDYRVLTNKNKIVGKLFIFTNAVLETDILTGFHDLDAFKIFVKEINKNIENEMISVAICDINGLSLINASKGRVAGDEAIKELADALRQNFPKDSFFVRGRDANLIVLSVTLTEGEIKGCMERVKKSVSTDVVTAVSIGPRTSEGSLGAIENAQRALQQKKLLDQKSRHSSALTSLIRALQECDNSTEAHVKRTQRMGAELGKRLGFTDVQLSDLSLLCLLHDIGKIAIPLEILNKPGKLNAEEWNIMREHAEKGYQIANSSPELQGIAEMIRHHHERWDGKGYPDGLSRETIPLLSRVIAVVDAYDAMVSHRIYRKDKTPNEAFDELIHCAGAQFDPTIVSEFVHMLTENPELGKPDELIAGAITNDQVYDASMLESPMRTNTRECVHEVHFMNYMLDAKTLKILTVNKCFEEVSGYTQEDVNRLNLNQSDLIPEEDRTEYLCKVSEYLAKNPIAYLEHRFVRKNGNVIYVLCMGRLYFDSATKTSKIEVIVIDSSNTYVVQQVVESLQNKANRQLRYWENTFRKDSLTGLLCRSAFQSDVEQKLLENEDKVMLLMLDVDKFKEFNDTYGHHAGDEFLILVAQTLEEALREHDLSCRMGGDEFAAALFFKKDCSEDFMYTRAQQIFDKINMSLNSATRGTTLSMGAVIANDEKRTFNQIYEASDRALYHSKENGRGRLSTT